MFSSVSGILVVTVVLAVVVMGVAALAEGRGRHLARLVLGVRPRTNAEEILAPVPRAESDWALVEAVASVPDRPAPGTRAGVWAADATVHAIDAANERAAALRAQREDAASAPRTGELGLITR
ncbi:hypothetical protein [Demequina sp. NBRC 110053]|uniref:hypothetical protein n=1 Tax=Demequina sp. NBRC 110053 TaxID=1570342 RepID=UPI0011848421|nr:hypothetical protein [Demequina sp. NBRC 110053]